MAILKPVIFIRKAASIALKGQPKREHLVGAVGIRADGALVWSYNGSVIGGKEPKAHAEARLSKKLDKGSVVFVVRVNRNGKWLLSKPCLDCEKRLKSKSVEQVWFTNKTGEIVRMSL